MKTKLTILAMVLLLVVNVNAIGISQIKPESVELLPGESARFTFQIQSVAVPRDLNCIYNTEGDTPLLIEFDQGETIIPAGNVRDILATITAPEGLAFGNYDTNLCAHCAIGQVAAGENPVRFSTCGLGVSVEVVGQRTRLNMPLPAKPFIFETWMLVLIVIIVALLMLISWWMYEKKRHKKFLNKKFNEEKKHKK